MILLLSRLRELSGCYASPVHVNILLLYTLEGWNTLARQGFNAMAMVAFLNFNVWPGFRNSGQASVTCRICPRASLNPDPLLLLPSFLLSDVSGHRFTNTRSGRCSGRAAAPGASPDVRTAPMISDHTPSMAPTLLAAPPSAPGPRFGNPGRRARATLVLERVVLGRTS